MELVFFGMIGILGLWFREVHNVRTERKLELKRLIKLAKAEAKLRVELERTNKAFIAQCK